MYYGTNKKKEDYNKDQINQKLDVATFILVKFPIVKYWEEQLKTIITIFNTNKFASN